MDTYLTEEIFSRLLRSLAVEISRYYGTDYPVLVGVGISGIEIIGRLPEILGNPKIETYACDVVRKGDEIDKITDFPSKQVNGKRVLIAYVRVDTGKTLPAVAKYALECGANDVKTMSIAVRNNTSCFPNFFCCLINPEDNVYLLLEGYPPDIEWAYPPVLIPPGDFVRELTNEDAALGWFECGDQRIDKNGIGEYLYYLKISKKGRVFIVERKNKIVGVLHFLTNSPDAVRIETLAVDKNLQNQGIGKDLLLFFIEYCKFKGIRSIRLDAFKERESFYRGLGFTKVKSFSIPSYGDFSEMCRRI